MWGRAKNGLGRLAFVIGGFAFLQLLDASSPGFGGPWVLILYATGAAWIWNGFFGRPPPPVYARTLRTRRLVLRRAVPSDLAPLHAILSDPEATRYWDTPPHASPAETQLWLDRMLVPDTLCDDFVIDLNGRVIGVAGSLRLPLVSFVFARSAWGKGYAREALAAYRDYIFGRGLPFLCAATDERNAVARALLASTGFREVGRSSDIWRVQGALSDAVHFRLNRDPQDEDWSDIFQRRPESVEEVDA